MVEKYLQGQHKGEDTCFVHWQVLETETEINPICYWVCLRERRFSFKHSKNALRVPKCKH